MSKMARSKALGTILVLSLALAGLFMLPAGASAEGTANLKVRVIEKDFLDNIENADVHCVNVHTGEMYDLFWDQSKSRYQADVPAGSYQIHASAEGYAMQESPAVVNMITSKTDDTVEIIRLKYIPQDITLEFNIFDGTEDLEGAAVHVFAEAGQHLMAYTNVTGYAKIKAPMDVDIHILIFYEGMKTVSVNGNYDTDQTWDVDMERPSARENSYKVIGFVKNGTRNIADISVHVWDGLNGHMVPLEEDFEGALSLPLYESVFHLLVEAAGYEPLWVPSIDLTSETYYTPDEETETFEMHKLSQTGSMVTTIHLENDMINPVIETVWTMDANSIFWGTNNNFGNPRMQISGNFYSPDWLVVDGDEANDTAALLKSFGPAYLDTDGFFQVNNVHFSAEAEEYTVDVTDLVGDVFDPGVQPVVTMNQPYTSELEYEDEDDVTIEVFNVMEGEHVKIILPGDYEILGEFEEDVAKFLNEGRSRIMVYEPIEFTAKIKELPEAVLDFTNSYEFYEVDDKEFIVDLEKNVTLTGRNSDDKVGEIVEYLWDLPASVMIWDDEDLLPIGDVDTSEMESITIEFHDDVHYNVTLGVKDTSGGESTLRDWVWITADGTEPSIEEYTLKIKDTEENVTYDEATGNYTIDEDMEILLNATSATDGNHGEIVDFIWLFDDESGALNGDVVTKRFADPGFYNIQLKLVDAVGNEEVVMNKTIVVSDMTDPMSVIKPFPDVTQGDEVEMNATQSYDPRTTGNLEEDIVSWTWYVRMDDEEWDDQVEIGDEQVFTYVFQEPGTYVINLSVEDKTGLTGYSEKILLVSGPDLQVLGLTFEDPEESDLNDGDKAKISIAYSNEGTVDINDTWTLQVSVNGKEIKTTVIEENLKPGEIAYFNFTYEIPEGDDERIFKVMIDIDGDIAEMNEDNNEFETTVEIGPKDSFFEPWMIILVILIVLVGYVVYMRFTRQEWGYEPIQRWWESRNK